LHDISIIYLVNDFELKVILTMLINKKPGTRNIIHEKYETN